jgi:hypothetical protein
MNPADEYDAILMVIGGRSDLSARRAGESAVSVKLVAEQYPDASLSLHLDGYDTDPRELWEIPEAARFIRWFAMALESMGLPPRFHARLAPESIHWETAP